MRAAVVGAGAWGLPAAAELARRGHDVTLIDAFGVGNAFASSSGLTRIWRLSHPDALGVRLGLRAVNAWRRLEDRGGEEILLRRGLLWRAPDVSDVAGALAAENVAATLLDPDDVGRVFPALIADGQPAIWQEDAGPLLAERALAAAMRVLVENGGRTLFGRWVEDVVVRADGVRLSLRDGVEASEASIDADVVVLAPGPFASPLLAAVGVDVHLEPRLQQVSYFEGAGAWDSWPCLVAGTQDLLVEAYAMATPGMGYKIGLEEGTREFVDGDWDRSPSAEVTAAAEEYVARTFVGLTPTAIQTQTCSWTDSPDGQFIVDRLLEGRVVVACGDSGQGFKFSALMGEVLADLVEGEPPGPDIAALGPSRFARG